MTVRSYYQPESVPEALRLLEEHGPDLLVMAGGTVAMPLVNEGISLPSAVMGLRRAGLDRIEEADDVVLIGAAVTLTALTGKAPIQLLRTAARRTASWTIRNMATVGGNLFTPPPGGDIAVALLALDAHVTMAGPGGSRTVPLAGFYTGFMTTDLRPGELVTSVELPRETGVATFTKFGRKHANTPAVVTVAARLTMDGAVVSGARIAVGAVGPHPMRLAAAEAAITGSRLEPGAIATAAAAAAAECEPFTDAVASEWYRRRMVELFVRRALAELAGETGTEGA